MFDLLMIFSWVLLILMAFKVSFFLGFSHRHHRTLHRRPQDFHYTPLVSIIVPSYNEGATVENCVRSIIRQTYLRVEIIIVDDGSTDDTYAIAQRVAEKYYMWVRVLQKKNGGKANALNYGIERARGEIIVAIDADTIFLRRTVEQLVLSFQDPKVVAVGGNVKVANRKHWLARHQALEYITGLTLQRRAFSYVGCMQVISGAIGAFRRDALQEVGGYPTDTVVEDMDVTIELAKRGHKIVYNPLAIAYTEAPESMGDFMKQRYRWTYGGFQVLSKHRDLLWSWRSRRMGFIGMPYFLIFPWIDVAASLLFMFTLLRVVFTGQGLEVVLVYVAMLLLHASLLTYALNMDKEDKRLVTLAVLDTLFYHQLLNYVTVKAGFNFLLKRTATWNKLQRYGRNVLPQPVVQQEET